VPKTTSVSVTRLLPTVTHEIKSFFSLFLYRLEIWIGVSGDYIVCGNNQNIVSQFALKVSVTEYLKFQSAKIFELSYSAIFLCEDLSNYALNSEFKVYLPCMVLINETNSMELCLV
jgi:hypothetical protein